ncbi:hypothetical protein L9F63_009761, partial [Diploptera punctata]
DVCMTKNGVIGTCQVPGDCTELGEGSNSCNMDFGLPVVCCTDVHRYPRQSEPWWLAERPFAEDKSTPISKRPGNDGPWWFQEKPFNPPDVLPPTIPPATPATRPQNTHTTNGKRISETNTSTPTSKRPSNDGPWWFQEKTFHQPDVLPPTIPPATPATRPQNTHTTHEKKISEIKCEEYSKLTVNQVSALLLVPNPDLITIDVPKCDSSLELIVGGKEASPKEFPHMAALGFMENGDLQFRCGGSLISEYYVLTAAHCAPKKEPPIIARLGDLNLKHEGDGAQPVNYIIVDIIRHPDYKPPAKYNDIALLKLDRKVKFNDYIRPACLYTKNHFEVSKTVATGWGQIDFAERLSDTLLKVVISIISNRKCNELYELDSPTRELANGIQESMMCAGELSGGKDTCQGDSGGPIQIGSSNNECVYNIIGVTSFGKFCAAKNAPSVYTRVSYFVPWIESIVWPDS